MARRSSVGAAVVVLAAGCHGGDPWEDVGPALPGQVRIELGAPRGVELTSATVGLSAVDLDRCDARPSSTSVLGDWWVVPPQPLHLEGGPWCALSVGVDGPLAVDGTDGVVSVALTLSLPELTLPLRDRIAVDGDAFVLRLGEPGWLDAADLDRSDDVEIGPGDPLHDPLVDALTRSAALYRDDEDGVLTEAELAEGPLTEP